MDLAAPQNVTDAESAIRLLPKVRGLRKIESWAALHALGLPTLPGVVIPATVIPKDAAAAAKSFAKQLGVGRLLLRSDAQDETGTYPRGGYLIGIDDIQEAIAPFVRDGRTMFLLEPKSPFADQYSLNVLAWPGESLVLEVVGPGFDASDLKRGDESPHERWRLTRRTHRVVEHHVASPESYQDSWKRRLSKVGRMIGTDSARATRHRLRQSGEHLLLGHETSYQPIQEALVAAVAKVADGVGAQLESLGLPGEPLAISMSYWGPSAHPVYWDIVWPTLKYEGARPDVGAR